jgi:predicted Zn-dependent protease
VKLKESEIKKIDVQIQDIVDDYFDKKYDVAEKKVDEIISKNPSIPRMKILKAQILIAKKNFSKAIKVLDEVPPSEQVSEYWYFKFTAASQEKEEKFSLLAKKSALQLLNDPFLSNEILKELKIYSAANNRSDLREKVCDFIKLRFKDFKDDKKSSCEI